MFAHIPTHRTQDAQFVKSVDLYDGKQINKPV